MAAGAVLAAMTLSASADGEWHDLFDGKSLDGWVQRGGHARYTVEDGQIVGSTRPNTPNSFLCTERAYADFELEYDFKVHPKLNSGVQIRSESDPAHNKGRVHGYQVEIDPSDRAWTAGVYDEARRGWLAPLGKNEAAQKAFKQDEWNHVRVRAVGDSIKTWLNDVPAANLVDAMTLSGFIALQVHNTRSTEPLSVRWRNLRIRELGRHEWRNLETGADSDQIKIPFTSRDAYEDITLRVQFEFTGGTDDARAGIAFGLPESTHRGVGPRFVVLCGPPADAGGLYDPARGALSHKPAEQATKSLKPDGVNELFVSIKGARVVVRLNGQAAFDGVLSGDAIGGFVGLRSFDADAAPIRVRAFERLVPAK
jgi:hypothetical protein